MPENALIDLDAACGAVLERVVPLESQAVELNEALGRHAAEEIVSPEPVPGFDNSAMDGFAVRSTDTAGADGGRPVRLELIGESRAGHPAAVALTPGAAIAISTGAVVPDGADSVVRVEDTAPEDDGIAIEAEARPGDNVRRAGEDIAAGAGVIAPGALIGPAELGVLASVGAARVACNRRPRVAVVSSGDELIRPDEQMRPGAVRNSNSYSISALARQSGAEVISNAIAPDRPEATRSAIEPALSADVAVVCGGVSVGEHDHVKDALTDLGVEQRFWRIALKPGKPTWFGTRERTLVFGLPGNPVSAMVTFLLLVRPALVALAGGLPDRRRIRARLAVGLPRTPGRTEAVRCRILPADDGWIADPTGPQGSHILTSMIGADGLALLPPGDGTAEAGETVEVRLIGPG